MAPQAGFAEIDITPPLGTEKIDWLKVIVSFVEFGLQIKQNAYPVHALLVTCANGRVGYIPPTTSLSVRRLRNDLRP
jgi:hypothetical protein